MRDIHLICNAHIDPVWQWEWEEGAAAAVSSFRAAADFCEECDDFVFCHNEALLYRWIEEYEPALFTRIQKLVKAGKWHVMGGWYLQPDCNMPSGESLIRQMQLGRAYFREKFGVETTTAVSFDAFGHSRGLVQLLQKAGFDSYLFMRPEPDCLTLPGDDFVWVGFDGSEVMAHRIDTGYNSPLGHAAEKVSGWLDSHPDTVLGLIPWGVGNHGGGPSRKDIADLNAFKAAHPEYGVHHSTPEDFFAALVAQKDTLPRVETSLQPKMVGCYTSQIRIKQEHRSLEGLLNQTERMLSHAVLAGLIEYPAAEMAEAARDLCMSEFHDILPGSSIQPVEETSLQLIHHGKEILSKMRARAFYALSAAQPKAAPGEYPVLVYNPFPYEITQDISCEFMLADQNWKPEFTDFKVYVGETELPAQVEKEASNIPLDWRKRVTFRATLPPMQISRFSCYANAIPEKPVPTCDEQDGCFVLDNGTLQVAISQKTGLLTRYCVDGYDYLADEAMQLLAIRDSVDAWGMNVDRFREVKGLFALLSPAESARFAGVDAETLPPVRVVEDGPVRTVIEAGFGYGNSYALITYYLPKAGRELRVDVRLLCTEKSTMFKLAVPTRLREGYVGQNIFGTDRLATDGQECVAQQWVAAEGDGHRLAVLNNGVYGSDCAEGEIRLSLLRSAAYTGHPIFDRPIVPQNRFTPRIDQGERLYTFVLTGGTADEQIRTVDRAAQQLNEPPYALSFFPAGLGERVDAGLLLEGDGVQLTAFRPTVDGNGYLVRLFETAGVPTTARLTLPLCHVDTTVALSPGEIVTLRVDPAAGTVAPAHLLD